MKHTLRFHARLNHSLTIRRDVEGMTEHPRLTLPGATYYFTVRLQQPGSTLLTDRIDALRWAYAKAVQEFPVTCHAMVVLPDHLHAIWTEPAGELWYAERWQRIKLRFSQAVADHGPERSAKRDGGLWQRRFRETAIRDADDYGRAMEHCRINPVRHGWASTPDLWPYSSFTKARGGVAVLAGAGLTGGPVGPAARPLQMSLARIA